MENIKFYTTTGSYYEVRKVNKNLYRIFYCWREGYSSWENTKREKMISSEVKHKKACKMAKHLQKAYNLGVYDSSY